mmetsp:Transcript_28362/g.47594  ORF Transcript_28362/g.47594 Transcript_28362/m.47594 type:complete len:219 (-) Transcript_28362:532-1188(-)
MNIPYRFPKTKDPSQGWEPLLYSIIIFHTMIWNSTTSASRVLRDLKGLVQDKLLTWRGEASWGPIASVLQRFLDEPGATWVSDTDTCRPTCTWAALSTWFSLFKDKSVKLPGGGYRDTSKECRAEWERLLSLQRHLSKLRRFFDEWEQERVSNLTRPTSHPVYQPPFRKHTLPPRWTPLHSSTDGMPIACLAHSVSHGTQSHPLHTVVGVWPLPHNRR